MRKFSLLFICIAAFYFGISRNTFLPFTFDGGWVNSFNNFRNAVIKNDKPAIKSFIDFPIMNENNEIWNLVYDNDYKVIGKLPANPQPFTASDLDKYFNKVFTKRFINTIAKVNTDDLLNKGASKTQEFRDGKITYKMFATYDKESQTLSLNLSMQTDDRSEDDGMFNVIYQFDIVNGKDIKFRQVRIAG